MTDTSRAAPVGWETAGRRGRRWRWALGSAPWLAFLSPAVLDALRSHHDAALKALTLLDYAAFVGVYLLAVPLLVGRPGRDPLRRAAPVMALVLGLLTLPVTGEAGLSTFVFVAVLGVTLLPQRTAFRFVAGISVLAVVLTLSVPGWSHDPAGLLFSILLATLASFGFVRLLRRNAELAEARDELARLAVAEERGRFARDLHDLLGHSLTVITVKAELAGRLLERDPQRAAAEVADIERLGREALADVRATVAGYRGVTLAAEVAAARGALEAAGISADLPGAVDDVPGERRELFGWVVREGVTNVVRHSGARRVRVAVTPTTVEVVDDGRGCPDSRPARPPGHGLAGLSERVTAAGGRLDAGPAPEGGFRLWAEVPA